MLTEKHYRKIVKLTETMEELQWFVGVAIDQGKCVEGHLAATKTLAGIEKDLQRLRLDIDKGAE